MYRMLSTLEKHKKGGTFFSSRLRDLATFYAVKYHYKDGKDLKLGRGDKEDIIVVDQ
jgi:hypothetical protein